MRILVVEDEPALREGLRTQLANAGFTVDVAGEKIRVYRFGTMRIGFVLRGKREFQLLCDNVGAACALLFKSFSLA